MVDLFGAKVPAYVAFILVGEILVLAVFISAWVLARIHKGRHHHYVILFAFLVDMLAVKPMMILRSRAWGPYPWHGSGISTHLWLDVVVTAIGVASILTAHKFRVKKNGKMFLPRKGRIHRLLGYVFLALWAATFYLGIRIMGRGYFGFP